MLQKWLTRLSSRICFMADSLYFFSLHSGFTLGKGLQSFSSSCSELPIALPKIPHNSPQSRIALVIKKTIKTPKLNTYWLEVLAKVLHMLIGLKGNNYYSKVFKRVYYKLSKSTFWVVISSSLHLEAWAHGILTWPYYPQLSIVHSIWSLELTTQSRSCQP